MKLDINNYPGSKGGSGVKEWIINHIPEYNVFYEIFGGSAVIARTLCVAKSQEGITWHTNNVHIVIEKNDDIVRQLLTTDESKNGLMLVRVNNRDGMEHLRYLISTGRTDIVVYADPPYLFRSRKSARKLYRYEWTDQQHIEFLELCLQAKFPIIISHYDHHLYNEILRGWPTSTFQTMTHGGPAEEKIYMNYDITQLNLATTQFLGTDYKDRQRIKRRKKAYAKKFSKMPRHERQAILEEIKKDPVQSKTSLLQ